MKEQCIIKIKTVLYKGDKYYSNLGRTVNWYTSHTTKEVKDKFKNEVDTAKNLARNNNNIVSEMLTDYHFRITSVTKDGDEEQVDVILVIIPIEI